MQCERINYTNERCLRKQVVPDVEKEKTKSPRRRRQLRRRKLAQPALDRGKDDQILASSSLSRTPLPLLLHQQRSNDVAEKEEEESSQQEEQDGEEQQRFRAAAAAALLCFLLDGDDGLSSFLCSSSSSAAADLFHQHPPVLAVRLSETLRDGPRDDRLEARDRDRSLEHDSASDAQPRRRRYWRRRG